MSKFKILSRRGAVSYKEKKLLNELQPILERKMLSDSNFAKNFRPVNSYEDLQKLHTMYCTENAEILDETPNKINNEPNNESEFELSNDKKINLNETKTTMESENKQGFTDPFNEEQPIIRDYVLKGDEFSKEDFSKNVNVNTNFNEPTNFDDAFSIPDIDDDGKGQVNGASSNTNTNTSNSNPSNNGNGNNNSNNSSNNAQKTQSSGKTNPVNPYFNDQDTANKKKQTKRFAKYITGFVCFALEKGYVWFATKNINEAKMIEYELKNEIDVSLMITLDSTTQCTAKEFFQKMCSDAKIAAKIPQDDQDELADALADVLMEKGIAPTAMQTLLMVGGQIVAKQATNLMMTISIQNNLLDGLRENQKAKYAEDEEAMKDLYKEVENQEQKEVKQPKKKKEKPEPIIDETKYTETEVVE